MMIYKVLKPRLHYIDSCLCLLVLPLVCFGLSRHCPVHLQSDNYASSWIEGILDVVFELQSNPHHNQTSKVHTVGSSHIQGFLHLASLTTFLPTVSRITLPIS